MVGRDAAATDKLARHPRTMAAMQLIDGAPVYSATDLVGFVACAHRFELERAALAGLVAKPIRSDPTIELIQERGYEHERRYLDDLRAAGRSVVEIARDGSGSGTRAGLREAAALTLEAMRARADVVYQATFFDEAWRGHADFLLRVDHAPGEPASALGDWHYEVADTKLARHVKAGAVLQICSYVEQLERVQGRRPEHLHVALGGSARETVTLRVDDYMAYFRRVKADFLAAAGAGGAAYPPDATYPEPVEHCDVCRWWADCAGRRRGDDDLSLVAGISARQRQALKELPANQPPGPIATRRGLARLVLPLGPGYGGGSAASLERVREQARIQVQGDERGELLWELLEPERSRDPETGAHRLVADRGFLVLPEPSPNDLFLDLEGDPFAFDDGIDYLFGILDPAHPEVDPRWAAAPDAGRVPAFRAFWSLDDDGSVTLAAEKAAFERTVDFLISRLDEDPTLHVYHYAAYEKTALARLAQRHATREDEVDRLLKGRVLVDLYRVVRQGIRASVESYSIKRLEPLYGFVRDIALKDAGSSIVEFEVWLGRGATADGLVGDQILRGIEGYNRDDVVSTWRLRDWLEVRRLDLAEHLGAPVPRPEPEDAAKEPPEPSDRQAAVAAVVRALLARLPALEPADLRGEDRATWLLAQLLGWHRRENKAFWWRYYDLCGLTDAELVAEREPIGMVTIVEDLGPAGRGGRRERYAFPPQDHAVKQGRRVDDPRAQAGVGTVEELDEVAGTLTLYRTAGQLKPGTPTSLIPYDFVPTAVIEDSLLRIGERVAADGIGGDTDADRPGRELLLRHPPRVDRARSRGSTALGRRDGARRRAAPRPWARRDRARDPGAARNGQDLDRRPDDPAARRRGEAHRRDGQQPQGDRQRAGRRSRCGAGRGRDRAPGPEAGPERASDLRACRGPGHVERRADRDGARRGRIRRRRRDGVAVVLGGHGGQRRRPARGRGRPVQPGQLGRRLARRRLARAPRRPPAARPAPQGEPPAGSGAERARPPARR